MVAPRKGKITVKCTYCGAKFKRYASSQINPKTGLPRLIVKCGDCRKAPVEKRFWAMVDKTSSENGCWLWTGALTSDGYPNFPWPEKKEYRGNRISWLLSGRTIPPKLFLLHKCPNKHDRACVNPDHLYIGNQSRNTLDQIEQGTHYFSNSPGSLHPEAKLDEGKVKEIRRDYVRGNAKELAEKYGVEPCTIRDVASGRSWKHVK